MTDLLLRQARVGGQSRAAASVTACLVAAAGEIGPQLGSSAVPLCRMARENRPREPGDSRCSATLQHRQ